MNSSAEDRMPYHCVAYGCGKTAEDGVTLFKFPKDPEEFHKWEKQVQRTRSQWVATPNSYLCSEHFGKDYFEPKPATGTQKLKQGAVPTVFVRPHCLFCSGVGCTECLPAIQQRGITAESREHTVRVQDYDCNHNLSRRSHKSSIMFNCFYHPVSFSLQAEYNEIITTQLDDSNDGGGEEHLTEGGVKSGGKNREERAGEVKM